MRVLCRGTKYSSPDSTVLGNFGLNDAVRAYLGRVGGLVLRSVLRVLLRRTKKQDFE